MADDLRPVWPGAPRFDPELGFPPYRFLPGYNERPGDGHLERRGFRAGVDLYHAGYLWEAHEAWEAVWKASGAPEREQEREQERELLQGLIQMAAALLKVHVKQWRGADRLLARARKRLVRATGREGLDIAELLERFDSCFGDGAEEVVWESAPRLRLR